MQKITMLLLIISEQRKNIIFKITKYQFLKTILDFYKRWFVCLYGRFSNNLTASHLLKWILQCRYSRKKKCFLQIENFVKYLY